MVAWPVVVGTTLVGLTYLLHAVVYGLTSTSWNAAPSALCRVLCTASLGFVGISNSFLGALGARVPDDGDLDKPAFQQSLAGSQSQETTSPESPASTSSTDTVPVPPVSSPTPESSDRRSHRQGIAASPRSEGGAASGRSAVGGLGLARIVTVSGRGTLTLGELAMEQFRRRAMELRDEWEDEERYVRRNVGRVIVNQSSRPTLSRVQKSTASARNRFRMRSLARLQEAARLESMASEIAAKLLAAGVDLSHVPGDASLTPGASDQGPRVGGDAAAPGTARECASPGNAISSSVRMGVSALRSEAGALEETLANKELYVELGVAERLAQSPSLNPPDSHLLQWRDQAIRSYSRHESSRRERAATLRAQADIWERRLASGDLLQEDPDGGSSSRETAPQPASKSDTTQGRRASRRRGRQQGQDAGEGTAATGPSAPSVSSASPMSRLEGSLRGTLLGSSVALPDMGRVPYIKLAIEKLRLDARRIDGRWASRDVYVRSRIAEYMLEEHNPNPSSSEIRQLIHTAQRQYMRRARARLEEAAQLQNLANDLERKAAAEGLLVRSPQETPPHRPPSSTDLPGAESEGVSSGFPPRPAPRAPDLTFADLAISNLRRDAEAIEGTWSHGLEYYVAQRAAVRMVRGNDPSPTPATQREWAYNDKKGFRADVMGHQQRARDLKDKANALEQELRALLSSASGQVPEPLRESGSTVDPSAEQSVERPSGKRKQKRKHLYHSSAESAGEGPSSGGAMLPALPLWLTPVSAVRLGTRQRDPSNPPVAVGPSPGSSSPEQHLPAARRSQRGSGPSSSTREHPPPATGGPLPQRYTPVPTTTPPYPADVERGLGDPTPPHPKKRRLLEFLSDTARLEKTPPGHRRPLGRLALTSTASHMASSSQMASGPPQVPILAGTHGRLSGSGGDIIPSLSLPLKKRPLRGPAVPRHAAAAAATPLVRQPPFRSGSLASAGTTSGTPSQPPSSMEPSAPVSAPAGDPGVEPRGQLRPPDPH